MLYELYVASEKTIKKDAARNAVTAWNNGFGRGDPAEIIMDARSLPEGGKRPTQPFAILGYRTIRKAANTRVAQFEEQLKTRSNVNGRRLVIAQESGLKVNNPFAWLTKGIVNDVTVTVVKDLDTRQVVSAHSDGVRVKLRDVKAVLTEDGGRWQTTIGKAIAKRYARMRQQIDHVDWYAQYGKGNQPRGFYIEQSTRRALNKLA